MKIIFFNTQFNASIEVDLPVPPQLHHKIDLHSLLDVKKASTISEAMLHDMLSKKWVISDIEWKRAGAEWIPYLEFTQCGVQAVDVSDSRIKVLENMAAAIETESAKFKASDEVKEKRMLEAVKSIKVAIHNLSS